MKKVLLLLLLLLLLLVVVQYLFPRGYMRFLVFFWWGGGKGRGSFTLGPFSVLLGNMRLAFNKFQPLGDRPKAWLVGESNVASHVQVPKMEEFSPHGYAVWNTALREFSQPP